MIRPLLFAAALVVAAAAPVAACTCTEPPSVEDSRALSAAVFTGVAIGVVLDTEPYPEQYIFTFRVHAWWKGPLTELVTIRTASSGAACGVGFLENVEYLVYAYPNPGSEPYVSLCSRTARAAGNPDIPALGPPAAVPASPSSWGRVKSLYR